MYKTNFNERSVIKFKHFSRRGYSLFSVLGKEVVIGVLSVATLQHATAKSMSNEGIKASNDSTQLNQSRVVAMDEVFVTGSRAPLAVSEQVRKVTVLGGDELQHAPVQSINDLIKYAAGVDVRQRGPIGAQTDVSIRGGNQEQIAVLLNGINICDPQTGHNAFDFPLDISHIKRIEILEGPAGRVYGTSSLLGAINIITQTPQKSSLDIHTDGGSYGYFSVGARGNITNNHWTNQLSTNFTRSDGYLRNTAGGLNADYKTTKLFYDGAYDNRLWKLNWYAGLSIKDFGSNTFYGVKYDDQFEHTTKLYTAIQAENKVGKLRVHPSVYWNRGWDRFELYRNAPDKFSFNYHRTDVLGANLNAYYIWSNTHKTAFGVEVRNENWMSNKLGDPLDTPHSIQGTNEQYQRGLERTNTQFYVEHNITTNHLTISGGFIGIKNSQADMPLKFFPSVDVSYRFSRNWQLYASYNTALRMPSFTELFYKLAGFKPDKHLRPEELTAYEVGAKYNTDYIIATASVFYNHHNHLIDWISDGSKDANNSPIWKSVNYGVINDLGIEFSSRLMLSKIFPSQHILKTFKLSYCYLNQDKEVAANITSKYVLDYLKHKLVAGLDMSLIKKLNLTLDYRFQHRMNNYLDLEGKRHNYGSYGIVDARLSWDDKNWSAYITGNNILGCHYVDVANVKQPGVWVVAGVSFKL